MDLYNAASHFRITCILRRETTYVMIIIFIIFKVLNGALKLISIVIAGDLQVIQIGRMVNDGSSVQSGVGFMRR